MHRPSLTSFFAWKPTAFHICIRKYMVCQDFSRNERFVQRQSVRPHKLNNPYFNSRSRWASSIGNLHQSLVHLALWIERIVHIDGAQVRVLLRPPPKGTDIDTMSVFFLFAVSSVEDANIGWYIRKSAQFRLCYARLTCFSVKTSFHPFSPSA